MQAHISVLLIYEQPDPFDSLKTVLQKQSLSAGRARTCEEARHLIEATQPHLIFTEARLPDGTWADVVRCAEKAISPSNVIVVSGNANMKFYIKAMEAGAFDFIMPPFDGTHLDRMVQSALSNVLTRRSDARLARSAD
jgi:DNA-binding NtrC family response regulator